MRGQHFPQMDRERRFAPEQSLQRGDMLARALDVLLRAGFPVHDIVRCQAQCNARAGSIDGEAEAAKAAPQ
jgi:hypothetical protein